MRSEKMLTIRIKGSKTFLLLPETQARRNMQQQQPLLFQFCASFGNLVLTLGRVSSERIAVSNCGKSGKNIDTHLSVVTNKASFVPSLGH